MGWEQTFHDPIEPPDGRVLRTLRDAGPLHPRTSQGRAGSPGVANRRVRIGAGPFGGPPCRFSRKKSPARGDGRAGQVM